MEDRRKTLRMFFTALIITIVVAVTLYLIFFGGHSSYKGNYAKQDVFSNINKFFI